MHPAKGHGQANRAELVLADSDQKEEDVITKEFTVDRGKLLREKGTR